MIMSLSMQDDIHVYIYFSCEMYVIKSLSMKDNIHVYMV